MGLGSLSLNGLPVLDCGVWMFVRRDGRSWMGPRLGSLPVLGQRAHRIPGESLLTCQPLFHDMFSRSSAALAAMSASSLGTWPALVIRSCR